MTPERAGFAKGDPRILELALLRLSLPPKAVVSVGDDPLVEELAARRALVPFLRVPASPTSIRGLLEISARVASLGGEA